MKKSFSTFSLTIFPLLALFTVLPAPVNADALSENLAKWKTMRPSHFQYRYGESCYCPSAIWLVEAEGETVTKAEPVIFSSRPPTPKLSAFSIDSLFSRVKQLQASAPDSLEVKYDSVYGFPASIVVDPKRNISDDERSVGIVEFKVLPTVSLTGPGRTRILPGHLRDKGSRTFDLTGRARVPVPGLTIF